MGSVKSTTTMIEKPMKMDTLVALKEEKKKLDEEIGNLGKMMGYGEQFYPKCEDDVKNVPTYEDHIQSRRLARKFAYKKRRYHRSKVCNGKVSMKKQMEHNNMVRKLQERIKGCYTQDGRVITNINEICSMNHAHGMHCFKRLNRYNAKQIFKRNHKLCDYVIAPRPEEKKRLDELRKQFSYVSSSSEDDDIFFEDEAQTFLKANEKDVTEDAFMEYTSRLDRVCNNFKLNANVDLKIKQLQTQKILNNISKTES
jgi:hypothetical protein